MSISSADAAVLESGGDIVRRYLSVGTRPILFSDQITAIHTDPDSHGIISLDHASSSEFAGLQPGMTVDIGTTPGAHDVGQVRLRYFNTSYNYYQETIAETAPADLPVEVGHYLSIRLEYLPWQLPKRVIYSYDGGGAITGVTEYRDYDIGYGGGAYPYDPKPNITAGVKADGTPKAFRRADWVDGYGTSEEQTYRTLTLSAQHSAMHNVGATKAAQYWLWSDGSLVSGYAFTDETIQLQLNVGFQYIGLVVTDSVGSASEVLWIGVWTHNDSSPPLTDFAVTSDETLIGRDMQLEFFGDPDSADETTIPMRAAVCYWEDARFAAGAAPEDYRWECPGWVLDDQPILRRADSRYGIHFGGAAAWKQKFHANSTYLLDTGSTPTIWSEVLHLTIDRAIDWSLRAVDTLRNLINVFYTGVPIEVEAATLPGNDGWTQIAQIIERAALAQALVDSEGDLYLTRPVSFLSAAERAITPTAFALTATHWWDEDGLTLPTERLNSTGVVNGAAELWSGGSRVEYASKAPDCAVAMALRAPSYPVSSSPRRRRKPISTA